MGEAIRKKQGVDTDVLTLARQRIEESFSLFDTVVVSFSGGKDSTAVLNLVLEEAERLGKLPVKVMYFDEEAMPLQTIDYVKRVSEDPRVDFMWLCLPIRHRNACSRKEPYWFPWDPDKEELWVRPMPEGAITWRDVPGFPIQPAERTTLPETVGLILSPEEYGRVGMFLGIRSDESLTRLRAVLMRNRDNKDYIREWTDGFSRGNLHKVYPIYDWRTEDVWTAPDMFDWDYNTTYDVMERAGIRHLDQRVAPPYGEEPLRGLWMYKVCFPEIWDRMIARVPGAATAARYSQTELYSYGKDPDKPDDMTWPEWLRFWIGKHGPGERAGVARRVADWLDSHKKKAGSEPIAVKAPHPVSGISWAFLSKIAIRGDYKGRRNPVPDDTPEGRERWLKEIRKMRASGVLK
jgi:predicted phosphoadenosine phosphosulfate sulfurtransferase